MTNYSRRRFLTAGALLPVASSALFAQEAPDTDLKGRIYKTLKIGMIKGGEGLTEKFKIAAAAGFEGVELTAPDFSVDEAREAVALSGIPVDGTVCAEHWNVRHSDPDSGVRQKALETLLKALETTHAVGGHSVLLVVGHGKDGSEEQVWSRSVENIAKAVPLAARLGVAIVVENVWNEFCYDPKGGAEQSASKFAKYIDAFSSPWVGMQFDIGNHWKFGPAGDWIRELDRRILKLDIKGFSRKEDRFTPIDEGDIDYADVRAALREIGYHGWCAAEVAAGDVDHLKGVAAGIDFAMGLA